MATQTLINSFTQLSDYLGYDKSALHSPIDKLTKIFLKYKDSKDILAVNIYNWSFSLLSLDKMFESKRKMFLDTAIQKLKQEVLVNPLDKSPLEHPILDRQWTWERWMVEDVLNMCSISPFDLQPMELQIHSFAVDMIEWANEYSISPMGLQAYKSNCSAICPAIKELDVSKNALKLTLYCKLAQNRIATLQHSYSLAILTNARSDMAENKTRAIEQQIETKNATALLVKDHSVFEEKKHNESVQVITDAMEYLNQLAADAKQSIKACETDHAEAVKKSQEQNKKIKELEAKLASMRR